MSEDPVSPPDTWRRSADYTSTSAVPVRVKFGPPRQDITPEQFVEMRERVAEMYAEDAERLRKRLEEDSPDI